MQSKRKKGNSFSCSLKDEEIVDGESHTLWNTYASGLTYHIMLLIPLAGRWFIPISQRRRLGFRERRSLHKTMCHQWVPEPAGSPGLTLADTAYSSMLSRQGSLTSRITVTRADKNCWVSSTDLSRSRRSQVHYMGRTSVPSHSPTPKAESPGSFPGEF